LSSREQIVYVFVLDFIMKPGGTERKIEKEKMEGQKGKQKKNQCKW
jgi:hypothetical protein